MTLREYLKTVKDEYVYVGAQSAYFYIGKTVDASEYIENLNTVEIDYLLSLIPKLEKEYDNWSNEKFVSNKKQFIDKKKRNIKLLNDVNEIKAEKRLLESLENTYLKKTKVSYLNNVSSKIEHLKNESKNFISLLDRKVTDTYQRAFVEPLGKVIIIDGTIISSKWWTIKEFESGCIDGEYSRGIESEEI